jgi:hypothetical protein
VDDSGQALALTPNRRGFSYRNDFGGENNLAPFAQASEAARNCKPGYLWPPHLYQEQFQSRGTMGAVSTEEFLIELLGECKFKNGI